jgi:phosphate transport system substrate-binding protein
MTWAPRKLKTRHYFTAVAILMGSTVGGAAQEVRLVNEAAGINITGTFISANEDSYVIESIFGLLNVARENTNCVGAACPTAEGFEFDLLFAGTDGIVSKLLPGLIDGYAQTLDANVHFTEEFIRVSDADNQPLAHISVDVATPSESFEWLADGVVDVIFTDKSPSRAQREMIEGAGGGDLRSLERERIIGVTGLVALKHPDNALAFVTPAQIAAIVGGVTTNWADVGGTDAPITIYALAEAAEISAVTARNILEPNNIGQRAAVTVLASQEEIKAAVANDPNGIAVVRYDADMADGVLPISGTCGIVASPSEFTLKAEEYPLSDRLFAYSHLLPGRYGREFVDFLDGETVDDLVSSSGFVDLSVITQEQTQQIAVIEATMVDHGDSYEVSLMSDLIEQMADFDRASTTLRFRGSSDAVDNRGQRDLTRILDYVSSNDVDTIMLVGYTDNQGDFDANIRLAEDRGYIIEDELKRADRSGALSGVDIEVQGYGALNPIACNDSADGRAVNRRVEVWFN